MNGMMIHGMSPKEDSVVVYYTQEDDQKMFTYMAYEVFKEDAGFINEKSDKYKQLILLAFLAYSEVFHGMG